MHWLTTILPPAAALAVLIAFTVYLARYANGHWTIYEDFRDFTWGGKLFAFLAMAGLLVSLASGTHNMLFFIPEKSGSYEDGEFYAVKTTVLSVVMLFQLGFFAVALNELPKDQKNGIYYSVMAEGYKRILEAGSSKTAVEKVRDDYAERFKIFQSRLGKTNIEVGNKNAFVGEAYEDLLEYINQIISK